MSYTNLKKAFERYLEHLKRFPKTGSNVDPATNLEILKSFREALDKGSDKEVYAN